MMLAALGRSGCPPECGLNMYLALPPMLTRNPGDDPLLVPLSMTQLPSAADSGWSKDDGLDAPSLSCARVMGWTPRRLVNQAESGTSSKLFTSTASPWWSIARASDSGRKTIWSAPSHMSGETYSSGAHETWCGSFAVSALWHATLTGRRSVSCVSGVRRGNRLSVAAPAASAMAGNAIARDGGENGDRLMTSPFPGFDHAAAVPSEATVRPDGKANPIDPTAGVDRLGPDAEESVKRALRPTDGLDADRSREAQQPGL